jgi:hypothetical protein
VNSARANHAPPPWPSQAAARPSDIIRWQWTKPRTEKPSFVCPSQSAASQSSHEQLVPSSQARAQLKKKAYPINSSAMHEKPCASSTNPCGGRHTAGDCCARFAVPLIEAVSAQNACAPFLIYESVENSDLCVCVFVCGFCAGRCGGLARVCAVFQHKDSGEPMPRVFQHTTTHIIAAWWMVCRGGHAHSMYKKKVFVLWRSVWPRKLTGRFV